MKFPYKIDPSKNPKEITRDEKLVGINKDSNGKDVQVTVTQKHVGIYKVDGDKLTICWSTKNRPPRFDRTGRVIDSGTSKERPDSFDPDVGDDSLRLLIQAGRQVTRSEAVGMVDAT